MREQIETKMKDIRERWEGKPEPERGSNEFYDRGFDRMLYRELDRKLKKLPPSEPKINVEEVADEVFKDLI